MGVGWGVVFKLVLERDKYLAPKARVIALH